MVLYAIACTHIMYSYEGSSCETSSNRRVPPKSAAKLDPGRESVDAGGTVS